jgi:7-cyano-7-deazaguanine synthase
MSKALLLMSGGLDSGSAAFYLASKAKQFDCAIFNYGQRSARMQLEASRKICDLLSKKLIVFDLRNVSAPFIDGSWLKPHEPIVHRNLVILPIAIAFAKEKGYDEVIIGTVKEDCEFERDRAFVISKLKELGEGIGVRVETPFALMPKWMLLTLGVKSGLDPSLTYSCLLGHKEHCGLCSQCLRRKEAFRAAKIPDPTKYYS